jgi:chemotaxis protein MotC
VRVAAILAATLACGALAFPALAKEPAALAPFQMVRSLQLVQDRIADGDHAALPMQNKLLEMIDSRFEQAQAADFEDPRNVRALLVYGMSGGNPKTLKTLLARVAFEPEVGRLTAGVHAYASGQLRSAQAALRGLDPRTFAPELGAFLALVQGSLIAQERPADALQLMDTARMLGPGSLVEEAALRRTLDLTTRLSDARRFERSAEQYVRRFIRSPYASQFVDAFLAGVVHLHQAVDLEAIAATIALMNGEQQRFVYLKLARVSAIDGPAALNAFAAAKAEAVALEAGADDPRALLYGEVTSVTADNVEDTLARLKAIDRSRLSANDQRLLAAAEAMARSVIAPPALARQNAGSATPEPAVARAVPPSDPALLAPALDDDEAGQAHSQLLAGARQKLDAIDALLETSTR